MKQDKACGAVIVNRSLRYLVVNQEGFWGFPKGHMEFNESEQDTAIREVKEETGLDVELIDGFRESIRYKLEYKPNTEKEAVYFLAKPKNESVALSDELKDYRWLKFEDAYKILSRDEVKTVLMKANEFLGS